LSSSSFWSSVPLTGVSRILLSSLLFPPSSIVCAWHGERDYHQRGERDYCQMLAVTLFVGPQRWISGILANRQGVSRGRGDTWKENLFTPTGTPVCKYLHTGEKKGRFTHRCKILPPWCKGICLLKFYLLVLHVNHFWASV
jgi:hypothetical protein